MFTLIIYTEKGDEIYTGEHFDDIDEDTEASALLREALSSRGYDRLVGVDKVYTASTADILDYDLLAEEYEDLL